MVVAFNKVTNAYFYFGKLQPCILGRELTQSTRHGRLQSVCAIPTAEGEGLPVRAL